MNALVFTEDNNLHITKPNGLRFQYENVDKPNLGFDFDVIVYDNNEEFKILNYDDSKPFEQQERTSLEDTDRDSIETYIEQSEAPQGVSLNVQIVEDLRNIVQERIQECAQNYRFNDLNECNYVGREGSNHPFRSEARRVLEFADATYGISFQVQDEVLATREDHLKPIESYANEIPFPLSPTAVS
tara:strand:- start:277 stop:834 length:558 start_codon:yes stop_codon:yes gene_type:complete